MDTKNKFEQIKIELLQAAYTFTGPSEDVDTIWVYISNQGGSSLAEPVFSVSRQVCLTHELDDYLTEPVGSRESALDLLGTFSENSMEPFFAWEGSGETEPTRIVSRYDVPNESLQSSLRYDDIKRGKDDTWGDVFEQWGYSPEKNRGRLRVIILVALAVLRYFAVGKCRSKSHVPKYSSEPDHPLLAVRREP